MNDSVIEAIRGDHNYFNVDVTGDIDAGDGVTFRAGKSAGALTTIVKTRSTGVVNVDTANGVIQVQLVPNDTSAITDAALLFEVELVKVDVNMTTTIAKGILRLTS